MTGNGLPAHYTPGEYTTIPTEDGYGVCSPDGQLRGPGFTTLGSARTRADEWNTIRRRMASIH